MSVIDDYSDPEINRRMTELEELTAASFAAHDDKKVTERVRVARMRLIAADIVVKLREIREYAISTNNWNENDEENSENSEEKGII